MFSSGKPMFVCCCTDTQCSQQRSITFCPASVRNEERWASCASSASWYLCSLLLWRHTWEWCKRVLSKWDWKKHVTQNAPPLLLHVLLWLRVSLRARSCLSPPPSSSPSSPPSPPSPPPARAPHLPHHQHQNKNHHYFHTFHSFPSPFLRKFDQESIQFFNKDVLRVSNWEPERFFQNMLLWSLPCNENVGNRDRDNSEVLFVSNLCGCTFFAHFVMFLPFLPILSCLYFFPFCLIVQGILWILFPHTFNVFAINFGFWISLKPHKNFRNNINCGRFPTKT